VSGTFCAKHPKGEFLAKGTGHLFPARSLIPSHAVQLPSASPALSSQTKELT